MAFWARTTKNLCRSEDIEHALSLETSRAQLIGLSFESSLSPEPTPSLKFNPSQAESSTKVTSASSQAGSQTKLNWSLTLSQGLEPHRVPRLESNPSRYDARAEPNRASSHAEQGFEPIQPRFESSREKPRVPTKTEPN